jgi:transcriptional regulator GlxA family with amidase domain
MYEVVTILYANFETLDVFGPVEVLGRLKKDFNIDFYSINGGIIRSSQGVPILTESFPKLDVENYILLIPGGIGTRTLINDESFLKHLKILSLDAKYVLTVCTGSILLAKTGFLDGKKATSNKRVFKWTENFPEVDWIRKSRWVKDENVYTSSGVSAGMDMALGFVNDLLGYEIAKQLSIEIEYNWNEDPSWDPFSEIY